MNPLIRLVDTFTYTQHECICRYIYILKISLNLCTCGHYTYGKMAQQLHDTTLFIHLRLMREPEMKQNLKLLDYCLLASSTVQFCRQGPNDPVLHNSPLPPNMGTLEA